MTIIDRRKTGVFTLLWDHRFGYDYLGVFSSREKATNWAKEYSAKKGYNNSYIVEEILDNPTEE